MFPFREYNKTNYRDKLKGAYNLIILLGWTLSDDRMIFVVEDILVMKYKKYYPF